MNRISELPEHVLPQKDAVQTCILSKSWRHLGPTRPKIEFRQTLFEGNKNKFLSVLENTLQRYVDQKLPIQEFIFETWMIFFNPDFESISVSLNEWIPRLVMNMGVKKFQLRAAEFPVPSIVFQAEFLEELSLHDRCEMNQINCTVKLPMLKRLVLSGLHIKDEAFEKILSNCPLIQHLEVWDCSKLRTTKVNKARNLKHFDCRCYSRGSIVFNDEAPSLETIYISKSCEVWYENYFFPRLKSLYLYGVRLPTEFVNNLSSNNCPCLEKLQLRECSGFTEFKLSNRSIKRLIISVSKSHPIEVVSIDAANMIYFEFGLSGFVPSIISFAATTSSSECKSRIRVRNTFYSEGDDFSSTWSLELYEFLKALSSQSRISLYISCFLPNQGTFNSSCEPVAVEHLCFSAHLCSSSALPSLFNCVFRIFRPRYVGPTFSTAISPKKRESRLAAESTWKALIRKGKKRQYKHWKQDLKKTSIQVLDEKTKEWRPGKVCELFSNQSIRFWLEWKI